MLPLKGVRVLDLTTINPFTTTEFSDYGATVIKVERPKYGDSIRAYPPFQEDVSVYHCYTDRGKQSITLNLRTDEGKEILKTMVKDADILIENFKAGTMEKMGLGFEELSAINPSLVYGKLSSYGNVGPQKSYIAYDIAVQAQAGLMDVTGNPQGEPNRVGCYASDHLSCTYLGSAIIFALYHAKKTGKGQRVEVSMLESVLGVLGEQVACHSQEKPATRSGDLHPYYAPYDLISCKNGHVAVAITTDDQWATFCQVWEKSDWATQFATVEKRQASYESQLKPELTALFAGLTQEEICKKSNAQGLSVGKVNTMEEAITSEQMKEREMLPTVKDQRIGNLLHVGKVIRFGGDNQVAEPAVYPTAPLLGENNKTLIGAALKAMGKDPANQDADLAQLQADGII